jgi:hypothetical protein
VFPNLVLIFSISFDLFKIVLLGDNASAFGFGGGGGGSTLLRDVVGSFITFWFLDLILILILILFILIDFRLFNIFLVVAVGLSV